MPLFEIYGSKVHQYRTIVSAADRSEAYDIAEARPSVDWNETETDSVIEIDEVIGKDEDE